MDKEKILTQENMIEKFYANQSKVKLYKKITKVKAKLAKEGDKLKTIINGEVETVNTAKKYDLLVEGIDGEQYFVNIEKFLDRYIVNEVFTQKFQKCQAKGHCYAYEFDGEDTIFIAPWNEEMIVKKGDFLATPDENVNEVYRIERNVFIKTYKESE